MIKKEEGNQNWNGILYLIAGGAIGAGLAMLFAPKSGKEMRADISNAALTGVEKAKAASLDLTEKAKVVYTQAQKKAADTYNTAKEGFSSTIESARENFSSAVSEVNQLPRETGEFVSQSIGNLSDKASDVLYGAEDQVAKIKLHSTGK